MQSKRLQILLDDENMRLEQLCDQPFCTLTSFLQAFTSIFIALSFQHFMKTSCNLHYRIFLAKSVGLVVFSYAIPRLKGNEVPQGNCCRGTYGQWYHNVELAQHDDATEYIRLGEVRSSILFNPCVP